MDSPPVNQPGFDLFADQGDKVTSVMIVLMVLSSSFVVLRLLSRKVAHAGYWVSRQYSQTQTTVS